MNITASDWQREKNVKLLPPQGGLVSQSLPAIDTALVSYDVAKHDASGRGDAAARTTHYSADLQWEMTKFVKALSAVDGRVILQVSAKVEQVEKRDGGYDYKGIENPIFEINLGGWLRQATQLAAKAVFKDGFWYYRTVIAGFVDHVPDFYLSVGVRWDCWHNVTNDIDHRFGCSIAMYYSHSSVDIQRVKPREERHSGSDSSCGNDWVLMS